MMQWFLLENWDDPSERVGYQGFKDLLVLIREGVDRLVIPAIKWKMKRTQVFLPCQISFIPLILLLHFSFPSFQSWVFSINTHSISRMAGATILALMRGAGDLHLMFSDVCPSSAPHSLIPAQQPARRCLFSLAHALPHMAPPRKISSDDDAPLQLNQSESDRLSAMTL